jgi:hypothetical protein
MVFFPSENKELSMECSVCKEREEKRLFGKTASSILLTLSTIGIVACIALREINHFYEVQILRISSERLTTTDFPLAVLNSIFGG